jgi:sortase B
MKKSGWDLAAKLANGGDRILGKIIGLLLIVALLYSGFCLWDTWKIYRNAGLNSDLLKYKPTITGADTPNPSLSDLQKINEDVCAWLIVDDTHIDYPVVQGETNYDYLNQAVDKTFSLSGSLFLDYRNDREFTDFYSLIYGHHMEGNVMFGELPNFLESDYFQSHTTGNLCTPEHTYSIEWFACLETDAYDSNIFNPVGYTTQESKEDLLDYIRESAVEYREIDVTASDQILALSTCASDETDGRVILIGRMSKGVQE